MTGDETQLPPEASVYVAGHRGMVGAAMVRELRARGHRNLLCQTHGELDLTEQAAVRAFFDAHRPEYVVLAAARVGGVYANSTYPAEFIYENLLIEANVIEAAHRFKAKRLLFLGSSCIYPRLAEQPMPESALLTGRLEPTNEPYAVAKIAGIKLCESFNREYGTDFRSVMPTNLYGPRDNFHGRDSHVIPALIRRFHEAKTAGEEQVMVWGSGAPRREFLHVDDMARAACLVMALDRNDYWSRVQSMLSHINIGCGRDVTIRELAESVAAVVGYKGRIGFDSSKPDGTPRKLLDIDLLRSLGWEPRIGLQGGLAQTYRWYCEHIGDRRE
jgi:GDP-L-fucose synthase